MTDDISEFYVHTATIETFQGAGAYGDVYGTPVVVACFAEAKRRMVRAKDGETVVSESTLYMDVTDGGLFVTDSRVTVNGNVSYVITQNINDAPGLGLPDHATVNLQ